MKSIGVVFNQPFPPNHLEFSFMVHEEVDLSVSEFVEIPLGNIILVGRIRKIEAHNEFYSNPEFLQSHFQQNITINDRFVTRTKRYHVAFVRIVRVIQEGKISPPEIPPEPGDPVYPIQPATFSLLLGSPKSTVEIGVVRKTAIPVHLDLTRLMTQHLLIIGSTGSGKSHTNAVLIEEILEKGLPVVVIDPHGEYRTIARARRVGVKETDPEPRDYPTEIFVPPGTETGDPETPLTIKFSELSPEEINQITGMTDVGEDLVFLTHANLRTTDYTIDDFIEEAKKTCQEWKFHTNTRTAVIRRLSVLKQMNLFGDSIPILQLLSAGHLTIIDLSSPLRENVRQTIAGYIAQRVFQARQYNHFPLPVLLVIEEAHRFAPNDKTLFSTQVLQRIAREGRKFGMGLCITTQMIRNLDPVIIAQCGTKIILRINNYRDLEVLAPHSDLADRSEIQLIPYLTTGTAYTTGVGLSTPVVLEIRQRRTASWDSLTLS